ncbi:hypothetical protein SCHPADRAFT_831421 [Schizopora paradoxa]|uniref:Phospholipid/glycerol acyltransferase domain-containing protein n=1 Tax=Schizopora paradoxa TaxID=27342 RepID=A0A0H2S2J8_9AGAM|nr:hypothetical protein SCHPADRAFT_831421 [Schizopora paradoxa]
MEKFSAYRDPGTGIQPFLRPVPPQESASSVAIILAPLLYALSTIRALLVICLTIIYVLLTKVIFIVLFPLAPLHRLATRYVTAVVARLTLFTVGLYWIPVEVVKRRKGRIASHEKWSPKPGDLIVSNWVSWLEVLWLVYRFDPMFILPLGIPLETSESSVPASPRTTPGRRTGTGSAGISATPVRAPSERAEITGFVEASLLRIVSLTGNVPPFGNRDKLESLKSLEDLRLKAKSAGRPIVVFPECTTSNGRGILRFGNVFKGISASSLKFTVFIMCARIDPPSAFAPTLSLSIPSAFLNPLSHIFSIASSPLPRAMSIRLLSPSDSPGSSTFQLNEFANSIGGNSDSLASICATLMGDIGRMKQVGLGWEDKTRFFDFFKSKRS